MMFVGIKVWIFSYLGIQNSAFEELGCSCFLVLVGLITLMMFVVIKVWVFPYLGIQVCVFLGDSWWVEYVNACGIKVLMVGDWFQFCSVCWVFGFVNVLFLWSKCEWVVAVKFSK